MSTTSLAAFWAVSFLFVMTPGPDWAYAIAAGLQHRTVLPAIGGLLSGHLAATAAVAAGVATLLTGTPHVLVALTFSGAAYLVWLGIGTLRHASAPQASSTGEGGSWVGQTIKGFGISGLNPKVFLLFLALLPQFTQPRSAWPVQAQIVVLGLVHVASCAVVYAAVGMGVRRVLETRPVYAKIVIRISGAAMIVIGGVLIVEQMIR